MKLEMIRKKLFLAWVNLFFIFCLDAGIKPAQAATIRQEKIPFKTYSFFDPDPVPRPGPIYPYFRFQGYRVQAEEKLWNMVRMENPYLEVLVAPEIGGKVWGVRERSTGRDFIYWNPVVKFREIALRGPWTSGGIEFNFGIIGHTPTTATPVDFSLEEKGDGSVACVVGAYDLPSRTRWFIRIRLPKNQAIIETEGFWFNPTCFHDSLYHWMTAAASVGPDLRFFHPGTHFIGHEGEPGTWPEGTEGRDLSYYRHNNFGGSKSYHILGEYGEFFAGLWEDEAFGYGHFAFYPDKPGMKLWLWSQARDGEIWRDLLTDAPKPQYLEMQTGFLFNQAAASSSFTPFKHVYFLPYQVIHWKEYWFPLKGLKRVVGGSPSGALNVEEGSLQEKGEGRCLLIQFCPLLESQKNLRIEVDGRVFHQERMSLSPLTVWDKKIPLPSEYKNLRAIIGEGEIIWTNDKNEFRLSRPLRNLPDFRWSSAEGCFVKGEELARQRQWKEAKEAFKECLSQEPGHIRALTRMAELELRAAQPETALDYARRALMIDTYDPEANFIYGTINRQLGRLADALDGFSWASRSPNLRSAAFTEMAEIFYQRQDLWRAKEYVNRALAVEPLNISAQELRIILHRKEGQKELSEKNIKEILSIDPLNHLACFEAYCLRAEEARRQAFLSSIQNELPHETFLELAFRYLRLRLEDEAVTLLELGPKHPLLDLTLAYILRQRDERRSNFYLQRALNDGGQTEAGAETEGFQANEMAPKSSFFLVAKKAGGIKEAKLTKSRSSFFLVFPFRQEMIPIFEWALREKAHWKLNYGLALIFWSCGREEEAEKWFIACGDAPDFYPFYLARARFLLSKGKDSEALADICRATEIEPGSWRAWHDLITFYEARGEDAKALKSAKMIYRLHPENTAIILDLARSLLRQERLRELLTFLGRVTILPYEGAWEGRDLYRQANILLAAQAMKRSHWAEALQSLENARKWPENLGSGRPYNPEERLELYLLALIYEKQGKAKLAQDYFKKIIDMSMGKEAEPSLLNLVTILTYQKMGEAEKAWRIVENWKQKWPENVALLWAISFLNRQQEEASKLVADWLEKNRKKSFWSLAEVDHYWPLLQRLSQLIQLGYMN